MGCKILRLFIFIFKQAERWTLLRDESIECMSNLHSIYMGLGLLGILIYYPVATFFYPNFQFLDKTLDLKYNPSFTVLVLQGKFEK